MSSVKYVLVKKNSNWLNTDLPRARVKKIVHGIEKP